MSTYFLSQTIRDFKFNFELKLQIFHIFFFVSWACHLIYVISWKIQLNIHSYWATYFIIFVNAWLQSIVHAESICWFEVVMYTSQQVVFMYNPSNSQNMTIPPMHIQMTMLTDCRTQSAESERDEEKSSTLPPSRSKRPGKIRKAAMRMNHHWLVFRSSS